MKYDIVVVSGYFNPLHMGHLDYLESAAEYGESLVVIVNNDKQVKKKGSQPFMSEDERLKIVKGLNCVSAAVLSRDADRNVSKSLETINALYGHKKLAFAVGADHNLENTPVEAELCNRLGMDIIFGVGGEKVQSSSKLLAKVKK